MLRTLKYDTVTVHTSCSLPLSELAANHFSPHVLVDMTVDSELGVTHTRCSQHSLEDNHVSKVSIATIR